MNTYLDQLPLTYPLIHRWPIGHILWGNTSTPRRVGGFLPRHQWTLIRNHHRPYIPSKDSARWRWQLKLNTAPPSVVVNSGSARENISLSILIFSCRYTRKNLCISLPPIDPDEVQVVCKNSLKSLKGLHPNAWMAARSWQAGVLHPLGAAFGVWKLIKPIRCHGQQNLQR